MNVGILGGGQLGRMLALAGYNLGIRCRFLEPAFESSAAQVGERIQAEFDDFPALDRFIQGLDVVTYEFENVPVETVRRLAERLPIFPPTEALATAQDRLFEKSFFRDLGIPVPAFVAVDTAEDFRQGLQQIGTPAILKTRRFGYDGKGQYLLRSVEEVEKAWEMLGGRPLILEQMIPFDRELSLVGVRDRHGATAFYPLMENTHREGMLRTTIAPAPNLPAALQRLAEEYGRKAMAALGYVGVLAIEFFEWNARLLVNEMAPRVHNSAHWTIEGARTSQFENHLRAVTGLPLGSTDLLGTCAMRNLIGYVPEIASLLTLVGWRLHWYGKTPRHRRKVGHLTIVTSSAEQAILMLDQTAHTELADQRDRRSVD